MVQETDFLSHWMTPTHIQPMKKKIDAILRMGCPKTTTQVNYFIGTVNFYKSLFHWRAHLLVPLNEMTGNVPFSWNDIKERTFCVMKEIIANYCINMYPDYDKPFDIYTNDSDYQVGNRNYSRK